METTRYLIETQAAKQAQGGPLALHIQVPTLSSKPEIKIEHQGDLKLYLFNAVKEGNLETVRWLLTYQPEWIKLKTQSGQTLLHLATQQNNEPMVELLLKFGGSLHSQNSDGTGLLHSAVPHQELAKKLIHQAPFLIEMRDKKGNTPLHLAAEQGALETLQSLIEAKAWIEAKNKEGRTALHVAAAAGQIEIVRYLLSKGANYQTLDSNQKLPQDLAQTAEVKLLFLEHRQFKRKRTGKHTTITGELSHTTYALLNEVYKEEADDLYQQTGIQIPFEPNQKTYTWPKKGGYFGKVGLARNTETGQFVAVKKIKGKEKIDASLNESKLQKLLEGQPNLMPLYDYTKDTKKGEPLIYQFMLYAEFGDGQELKKRLTQLNQPELLLSNPLIKLKILIHTTESLLIALNCMHQNDIIHGDIKPDNLLIDRYGRIYLADFGCAFSLHEKTISSGDIRYLPPEQLLARDGKSTTCDPTHSDAWSIGITLLEIASYLNPQTDFHPDRVNLTPEYLAQALKLDCLNYPGLFQIIKGLLAINPKERLTVQAALQHELFQNPLYELTEAEKNLLFQSKSNAIENAAPSPNLNKDAIYQPDKKESSELNIYNPSTPIKAEGIYQQAIQAEKNNQLEQATQSYQKAAELGHTESLTKLGLFALKSKDKSSAYTHFLKAANQGDITAMTNLAQMLEYGDGIPQDKTAALKWYRTLADKGVKTIGSKQTPIQSKIDKLNSPQPK